MCRSRFTCTRQPDRYDVQPESQAVLLCRRMHGSSRFATSPPYQKAPPIGQHPPPPPPPPTVTTRAGLAIGRTPPPSVVGRNGRRGEISRTPRRNSLFTAAPPSTIAITPPPPRRRSVLWLPGPNLVPSPALVTTLTPAKHTHIGGLHLLRLEHIRLHRSLLSGSHFSPKLKCCHSNTTPSSRLPLAGRNGRCKYRLWAAHAVAH